MEQLHWVFQSAAVLSDRCTITMSIGLGRSMVFLAAFHFETLSIYHRFHCSRTSSEEEAFMRREGL